MKVSNFSLRCWNRALILCRYLLLQEDQKCGPARVALLARCASSFLRRCLCMLHGPLFGGLCSPHPKGVHAKVAVLARSASSFLRRSLCMPHGPLFGGLCSPHQKCVHGRVPVLARNVQIGNGAPPFPLRILFISSTKCKV